MARIGIVVRNVGATRADVDVIDEVCSEAVVINGTIHPMGTRATTICEDRDNNNIGRVTVRNVDTSATAFFDNLTDGATVDFAFD